MQTLLDRLDIFSRGALTPEEQLEESRRRVPAGITAGFGEGATIGDIGRRVRGFQFGGRMVVDPGKRRTPGAVQGPVSILDRLGRAVGVAGEGGSRETIDIRPVGREQPTRGIGPLPRAPGPGGVMPQRGIGLLPRELGPDIRSQPAIPQRDVVLSRDEQFSLEELQRAAPHLTFEQAVAFARNPASLEALSGVETDPRSAAARLVAGAVAADQRFGDPFVRSLALGRAPAPGTEATMRDLMTLSPDLLGSLQSVLGPGMLDQYLFELGAMTPTGTRARGATVGGLRLR